MKSESKESHTGSKVLAQLFCVQILAKLVTLPMSFMTARLVSQETYGYANMQMQLWTTLILFFQREALRKTCQRDIQHPQ